MKIKTRVIYIILILSVTISLDQITKKIAHAYLAESKVYSFFHNVFVLQYVENKGGFLGMGAAVPESIRFWVFSVAVSLFLIILFFYLVFSNSSTTRQFIALSAILGGGAGNLIDRLLNQGRVVDFMNFGIGSTFLRTGILNVADLFITFGAIFLLWFILMDHRKDKEKTSGFPGQTGE